MLYPNGHVVRYASERRLRQLLPNLELDLDCCDMFTLLKPLSRRTSGRRTTARMESASSGCDDPMFPRDPSL